MNIPGNNLLNKAFKLVKKASFNYLQFDKRTINEIGIDIPTYKTPIELKGSIQAVPRRLFQQNGLDWGKYYIMIYSTDVIEGIKRNTSGDRVEFNGKLFQVLEENNWSPIDGWNGVICVQVPA